MIISKEYKEVLVEMLEELDGIVLSSTDADELAKEWVQCGVIDKVELEDWMSMGYVDPVEVKQLKEAGHSIFYLSSWVSDQLPQIFGESVEYEIDEHGKEVILDLIRVTEEKRGKGQGRWFMEELCRLADETKKEIKLTPSDELGSDLERLIRFYESFGFVSIGKEMKREPRHCAN